MYTEIESIVIKYLIRHYPVERLKDKKRFKRGIEITVVNKEGFSTTKKYFFKNDIDVSLMKVLLLKDVLTVFGFKPNEIVDIISDYIEKPISRFS